MECYRIKTSRDDDDDATYTTSGSVRGCCGHRHRTLGAAVACLRRDQDGCASQGGYSDRDIIRSDGNPLTEGERFGIDEIFDRLWKMH